MNFVYDRKKKATAKHAVAVELRINYDYRAKYMSTGVYLLPKEWRNGMVVNRPDAIELNQTLATIKREVLGVVNAMLGEGALNIMEIPDRMERRHSEGKTFIEFCEERADVRKYGRSKDSAERYERFLRFFRKWGKMRFFSDVTDRNVLLMDEELNKRHMANCSKWNNYHRFLNSFIIDAMSAGLLKRNPYKWVHIDKDKKSRALHKYLTLDELKRMERTRMATESLEKVRDLFVFQTYTCLSYTDLASFDVSKCKEIEGGRKLYSGKRGKTGQEFSFVLLKPAVKILQKYDGRLPLLSNVKYNEYLKIVAQAAHIDKPITSHWARHTGATILLNEGVDMEIVAKILGHSSTRITRQVYAKLLDDTVAKKMLDIEGRL